MVRSRQGRAGRDEPAPAVARRPAPRSRWRAARAGSPRPPRRAAEGSVAERRRRRLLALVGFVGLAMVIAAAALLRLWSLDDAPLNPFYDAAVRSMGLSWHNFFFGALEPGGRISVDKPPVDLWLQVASTQLSGFNAQALLLPEALGGCVATALLYAAIRPAFGRRAALLGALALAVVPISVVTSRSDTMDSVMMALLVAALWAAVTGLRTRHVRWVVVSAALVGLAFNVKLSEALVPLPALALMWWNVASGRRRLVAAASAGAALAVVGMLWVVAASLTPLDHRPYPIGSRNGSIYQAVFVYNGVDRLNGTSAGVAPVVAATPAGADRLLSSEHPFYGEQIGLELVAALALGLAGGLAALRGVRVSRPKVRLRLPRPSPPAFARPTFWAALLTRARKAAVARGADAVRTVVRAASAVRTVVRGSPRGVRRSRPSRAPAAAVVLDGRLYAVRRSPPPRPTRSVAALAPAPAPSPPIDPPRSSRSAAADGAPGPRPSPPPGEPARSSRSAAADGAPGPRPAPVEPPRSSRSAAVDGAPGPAPSPRPAPGEAPEGSASPARDGDAHARRWLVIGVGAWLATAAVLFSAVRDLQPRYLEAVTPALAAMIGIGGGTLLRRAGQWTGALLLALALAGSAVFALTLGTVPDAAITTGLAAGGLALVLLVAGLAHLSRGLRAVWSLVLGLACATALLAAPTGVSINLVDGNATAAGIIGAGAEFADYLHAHRHGAYYEVASSSVNGVTTLIAQDAQPVLVLNDFHGALVTLARLKQLVELKAVRHVIISRACQSGVHCPLTTRWSLKHAREVMRGGLYEYILPVTAATDQCSAASGHQFSRTCSRLVPTTTPQALAAAAH